MRQSPLADRHRALGATMTGFGGFEMPLDYGSVLTEHREVRESCGLFDLSHLGTLTVRGPGAPACLQRAFTNDAEGLATGRAQYTLCLNEHGGIVDDLLLYRLAWGFLVVPNAANTATVLGVLDDLAADQGTTITDVKADTALLAVQGPRSAQVLEEAGISVAGLGYLECRELSPERPPEERALQKGEPAQPAWNELGGGVLARSGYTGERGYEVFIPVDRAPWLWDRLVEVGAAPAGLGARDTLRLEMGYALHGNDISTDTSPVEARLGWAVKPGTGFRGERAYTRDKERGPRRRLWGLRATGRGIPRAGCDVSLDGTVVGRTTSGTFSPTLRVGIAMGYLDAEVVEGTEVVIDVRGKSVPAVVTRPPFVDRDPKS